MQIIDISDAQANLAKLIEQALTGQEIVLGKAGRPVARLAPYDVDASPRQLGVGSWKGKIWIAADFNDVDSELIFS